MTSSKMQFGVSLSRGKWGLRQAWADAMEDRLGIQPLAPSPFQKIMAVVAWGLIILAYWVGDWTGSIQRSLLRLSNDGDSPTIHYTAEMFGREMGQAIGAILISLLGIALFSRYRPGLRRIPMMTAFKTLPLYYCMPLLSFVLIAGFSSLLGLQEYNYPDVVADSPATEALWIIDSAFAGPAEEMALLMLPVIALRRTRHPWWLIITVAVVLRVPFHLYYGWGAILLGVWAALAVLLYRRMGYIVPFILSHALNNTVNSIDKFMGDGPYAALTAQLAFVSAVVILTLFCRRRIDNAPAALRFRRSHGAERWDPSEEPDGYNQRDEIAESQETS